MVVSEHFQGAEGRILTEIAVLNEGMGLSRMQQQGVAVEDSRLAGYFIPYWK